MRTRPENDSERKSDAALIPERYEERYPDVAASGLSPEEHLRRIGTYLGRAPNSERGDRDVPDFPAMPEPPDSARDPYSCVDLNGKRIHLNPMPAFGGGDYEIVPRLTGPVLVIPTRLAIGGAPLIGRRIAVHLHLHYPELAAEFVWFLKHLPYPFRLLISVTDASIVEEIEALFDKEILLASVTVRAVPNRGRDIASMLSVFRNELADSDFFSHVHTKRSPHNRAKADWRFQLLHGLMASTEYVENIFSLFAANPHLGLIYPEYHWALDRQISWGTNYSVCCKQAERIGIRIREESLCLFPAGSMFWARTRALEDLLDVQWNIEDFPDESGQVDGTPAHAIERLLGEIAWQKGFGIQQVKPDRQHTLTTYYSKGWPYRWLPQEELRGIVKQYRERNRGRDNRIAVFTAITGGYDRALLHERLDERVDYFLFTDAPINDCGFWRIRSIDYHHPDSVRKARYVKTHPHKLLAGYDIAIWIDASVMIRGDIMRYVERFEEDAESCFHGVDHPQRECTYEEARALKRLGKDAIDRIDRQMKDYRSSGLQAHEGLIETNFLITDIRSEESRRFYQAWWGEIVRFSHRDQLGIMAALKKSQARWGRVFSEKRSLRNHQDFAYFGHGSNSGLAKNAIPQGKLQIPATMPIPAEISGARPSVDIVVCVHNALDVVEDCLESVLSAMADDDILYIVDDGSDAPTEEYLKSIAGRHRGVNLMRHDGPPRGYCRSANAGIVLGNSEFVLLLNSDAIIVERTIDKLMAVAGADAGVVGPVSNAASFQSLPDVSATPSQTAVNVLPDGMSVAAMDDWCEQQSRETGFASVPLVHGFCQLIRREAFNEVGLFDEKRFPYGYGEENDFCFRVANRGHDLRVATNAFVFHAKSASYQDGDRRRELMMAGSGALRALHGGDRLENAVRAMEEHPVLMEMRRRAAAISEVGERN